MNITIKEFFDRIDFIKDKNDFYYAQERGGNLKKSAKYYNPHIAEFDFNTECQIEIFYKGEAHINKMNNIIDVSGYLVYDETPHIPSFLVGVYHSLQEVNEFLLSGAGLCNVFTSNIIVLYEGVPLKYRVKSSDGKYITCDDIDFDTDEKYIVHIEWEEYCNEFTTEQDLVVLE